MINNQKFFNISTLEAQLFLKLYETENSKDTANFLGWSIAQVINHLSKLESKLGRVLFKRNRRLGKFIPNEEAHLLRSYMEQLINISNLAYENIHQDIVSVKIRSSQSIIKYYLGPYIKPFLENNKDFRLSFMEQDDLSKSNQSLNEICITHFLEKNSRYTYIPYHTFKQNLWASRKYIKEYGSPNSIEDLYKHRLILRKHTDNPKILFGSKYIKLYLENAKNPNICDVSGVSVADYLCEQGCGIMAGASESIYLANIDVVQVFPEFEGDTLELYVAVDKSFLETTLAKKVVNWIFECRNILLRKINVIPAFKFDPYNLTK